MRWSRLSVTAIAAVVAMTGVSRALVVPCPAGQYAVAGAPLLGAGAAGSDSISFNATGVVTLGTGGCGAAQGRVRATAKVTKVRGVWKVCGGNKSVRLRLTIDGATCQTAVGKLSVRGRARRDFTATLSNPLCSDTTHHSTFDVIQQRIFDERGCAVSTCHGSFGQGGLDLRDGAAYGTLVGVAATNAAAAAAGKIRVVAGDAAASFLSQKLRGTIGGTEGSQMPLVGGFLNATELALVDAWIAAGAPQTGFVEDAPCLPPLQYHPATAPPVPPGGYQVVLNGPTLQPGEEQEGCFWIPTPSPTDFTVGKWEFALNPGTHHFAVYQNRVANPPLNQWLANDFGCFNEADFGQSLSGAPQAPYYVDAYPAGMGRVLGAGRYLGLNAHYHNDFNVPIQVKVWVNIHPYQGTPQHYLQTLTSLDTTFNISVPPFTQAIRHGHFVNNSGVPMRFISLSGHMHKRGLRFTAWSSDGVKRYETFDWAHPLQVNFTSPLVVNPGDYIDYECLHDNGVTRPVKMVGGTAATLAFGVTTDDEMCILPGTFYTD